MLALNRCSNSTQRGLTERDIGRYGDGLRRRVLDRLHAKSDKHAIDSVLVSERRRYPLAIDRLKSHDRNRPMST